MGAAGISKGGCARQYGFEKCGFTALERAHQCNAPWTSGTSDVLSHCRLLVWSSAHDWVGKSDAPPVPTIWQVRKSSLRCEVKNRQTAGGSIMIRNAAAKFAISMVSSQASCREMPCKTATMTRA